MTEQTIFRNASADKPYSMILNAALQDADLTPEAGWLLVFMLSQSRGWRFSIAHVIKYRRMGRDRIYKALGELIDRGYCNKERMTGPAGATTGYEYQFTDEAGKFSARNPEDQEGQVSAVPGVQDTGVQDTGVQGAYKETKGETKKREKLVSSKSAPRELPTTEYSEFHSRGRRTTLDDGWELPADWREASEAKHPHHVDMIDREASRFRKFNVDKLTASDDWQALWERWFDLAVNRSPGSQKARAIRDYDPGATVHNTEFSGKNFQKYVDDCIARGVYKPKTERKTA